MSALPPGSTIGILGGGQLGRMLSMAAARLGFDCHIYTPEADSCAARVSARETIAPYEDERALAAFAKSVQAITYEFENVPAATAEALAKSGTPVFPGAKSLAVAQDRAIEKEFFASLGIATAPFAKVEQRSDLDAALKQIGAPAILKTRRLGYDGKGQARLNAAEDADSAYAAINAAPAILEGMVNFEREISVIAARGQDGAFAAFDVCENEHNGGILAVTRAPARIDARVAEKAIAATRTLMDALGHVGVLAVEFFLMADGALLANEFAPRVHNSGHWTEDACLTSQFEQHIRAIAGWPLGPTTRFADAEMHNLIGDDVATWAHFAADPDARLHLYGKGEARQGRKMGHVNRIRPRG
ncbi:MAG TPA: 5-(carboxyamino)imidazole ribonucleotide synthase [Caulobacterales bacterium]|nr:5-(carboxyamino)imidazole ribonucleotide synthase [Caulobacterales bacterium]